MFLELIKEADHHLNDSEDALLWAQKYLYDMAPKCKRCNPAVHILCKCGCDNVEECEEE
jgi:hypothetical protein